MDLFMKILGICIGLFFLFIGIRFAFRSTNVINGIQRYKYHETQTPRKQELLFARIIGVLLILVGLYFTMIAVLSLFPDS
ncbi:MAG TPA: hypothetical protein PLH02_05230 [Bacillota bacterium]|nr:hypothetical protein [Bacillota bacterium]HPF42931.1 hypothetical protein [Bacillota bacterium]HPJ85491.1 hypothetical protein [Bacillota bacterium]HPQ62250.1 hypothetical protein [Bacillota bacterium]